jgi:hypothetical protein
LCGVPIYGQSGSLGPGRQTCAVCRQSAITNIETARDLYGEIIVAIERQLRLHVHRPPGLALVSAEQLAYLSGSIGRPPTAHACSGYLLGAYVREGKERAIYVQTGLPRLWTLKVIAHEYGHAWQAENAADLRDPLLVEGFCEWMAYHAVAALSSNSEETLPAASGFYGDALRAVLAIEQTGGIAAVVAQVRS